MPSKRVKVIFIYIVFIGLAAAVLFPLYWTFLVSTRAKIALFDRPIPYVTGFEVENYSRPFLVDLYGRYLLNSLIIASGNAVLVLAMAIPAAYALSRFKIRGRENIFFWLITNRMAPPAIFIIPLYLIFSGSVFRGIRLIDTHLGMILVYCIFNLPFAIWLLKGMIDGLPIELDEAAVVDGCSYLGILRRVIIPVAKPSIVVTGVLIWLFSWNEMLFASILTSTRANTITAGILKFVTVVGVDWGEMAAVSVVCLIPAAILVGFAQKHVVAGLTFGAVKE